MNQVSTAVILAAGMGNRLRPFTDNKPKCLVEVNGIPLLTHAIRALESHNFKNLIIVTGYEKQQIEQFVSNFETSIRIETIENPLYATTNNIYSLWLCKQQIEDGFLLLESDLVYDFQALSPFLEPDHIALDIFNPTKHSGTTATIDNEGFVRQLYPKGVFPFDEQLYKTVNITSFSATTWSVFCEEMENLIASGKTDIFYEVAIQNLLSAGQISLKMVDFSKLWWDEIDTMQDLERVNKEIMSKVRMLSKVSV